MLSTCYTVYFDSIQLHANAFGQLKNSNSENEQLIQPGTPLTARSALRICQSGDMEQYSKKACTKADRQKLMNGIPADRDHPRAVKEAASLVYLVDLYREHVTFSRSKIRSPLLHVGHLGKSARLLLRDAELRAGAAVLWVDLPFRCWKVFR